MYKTISYFELKPITRIVLLKPILKNAIANINVIEKDKFKNMIISVMKEKKYKKKEAKRSVQNKIKQLFLYNKKDDDEDEEQEEKLKEKTKEIKEENIIENNINKKHINISDVMKKIIENNINKKHLKISSELFYKYDKTKENTDTDNEEKKFFQKIKKKSDKNFNKYFNEDEDFKAYYDKNLKLIRVRENKDIKKFNLYDEDDEEYDYLKEIEEIKMRRKKRMEQLGKNFEEKYKMFKEELERLKKLSDEDFLRDTFLFLNKEKETEYFKKDKKKLKINRINEYKDFIKQTKNKRNRIDNFYSSQIIFKPNCEFIIDKINVL